MFQKTLCASDGPENSSMTGPASSSLRSHDRVARPLIPMSPCKRPVGQTYVTSEAIFRAQTGLRLAAAPVTTPHAFNHRHFGPDCRTASDR